MSPTGLERASLNLSSAEGSQPPRLVLVACFSQQQQVLLCTRRRDLGVPCKGRVGAGGMCVGLIDLLR